MWIKTVYSLSSFLSFNACSLEGQSTGNHEVQYQAKIKRGKAMKYSPPGVQLLLTHPPKRVLCLRKSEGTETLTLLREGNYSCTVWGENTHANSASSWDSAGVNSEKNMLFKACHTAASMTALGPTHTLGAAGEAWEPLQSAIQESQEDTEHRDLHRNKVAQTSSLTFIRVHHPHFHLPAPEGTWAWLFIRELVEHPERRAQFQMSYNFPGLFLQSRELKKNPGCLWPFPRCVGFDLGNTAGPQAAQKREYDFVHADALSSTQDHIIKYLLLQYPIHITRPVGYYMILQILCAWTFLSLIYSFSDLEIFRQEIIWSTSNYQLFFPLRFFFIRTIPKKPTLDKPLKN